MIRSFAIKCVRAIGNIIQNIKLSSRKNSLSLSNNYFLNPSYISRTEYSYFDDTYSSDEYQLEVYDYADNLMKVHKLNSVIDIGCGSAYKLINKLGQYDTIGIDVSPTYEFLLEKYPERKWMNSSFSKNEKLTADLVICSDVIEHILNPDELLDYIARIDCKFIILSTLDRGLRYKIWTAGFNGPPSNSCHIREWNFHEFEEYISSRFNIIEHIVTNRQQCTQMIVAKVL